MKTRIIQIGTTLTGSGITIHFDKPYRAWIRGNRTNCREALTFTGKTRISTKRGMIRIDELKEGDIVMSVKCVLNNDYVGDF